MNKIIKSLIVLSVIVFTNGCVRVSTNHFMKQGLLQYSENEYQEAQINFDQVISYDPDNCIARLYLGWISYYSEDYRKAQQEFSQVLNLTKKSMYLADARHGLARCAYKTGQFILASENAKQSLRIKPKQMELWLVLGWSELYCYRYQKSETAFRKALLLETANGEAWLGIGWSIYYRSNISEAIAAAKNALKWGMSRSEVNKLMKLCQPLEQ